MTGSDHRERRDHLQVGWGSSDGRNDVRANPEKAEIPERDSWEKVVWIPRREGVSGARETQIKFQVTQRPQSPGRCSQGSPECVKEGDARPLTQSGGKWRWGDRGQSRRGEAVLRRRREGGPGRGRTDGEQEGTGQPHEKEQEPAPRTWKPRLSGPTCPFPAVAQGAASEARAFPSTRERQVCQPYVSFWGGVRRPHRPGATQVPKSQLLSCDTAPRQCSPSTRE